MELTANYKIVKRVQAKRPKCKLSTERKCQNGSDANSQIKSNQFIILSCIVIKKCDDYDNKSLDCVIRSTGSVMPSHNRFRIYIYIYKKGFSHDKIMNTDLQNVHKIMQNLNFDRSTI